jgi:hypothetical protein
MAVAFHQFEVTRPLRGSGDPETRTAILPTNPGLPSDGYWVARLQVHRLFRGATEIRYLGITTRQIWEVVAS